MNFCLIGEQITAENFTLLDDGDLRDLGFAMGHRKMLLVWIAHQKANEAVTMEPQAVLTPLTPASHVSFNNSSTASPVVDPSTCGVRNKENFTSFKASLILTISSLPT